MGLFQHCIRRLIVLLPPNEFLHSSSEAPRTIQARETSASEGRNYYQGILLANPEFTKVLGSFTCRRAGTLDRFFHFPSEGRNAEDYSDTRKIQRLGSNVSQETDYPETFPSLGVVRKTAKIKAPSCLSVSPSVRLLVLTCLLRSAWNNSTPSGLISMKSDI